MDLNSCRELSVFKMSTYPYRIYYYLSTVYLYIWSNPLKMTIWRDKAEPRPGSRLWQSLVKDEILILAEAPQSQDWTVKPHFLL